MQDDFNSASVEWFALSDGMYPLVPRPEGAALVAVRGLMPLAVLESPAFRATEDIVSAALLMLSQSPAARDLAQLAIQKGYSLHITGANRESADAVASANTDPVNRRINIGAVDDAATLALRIIHELVHVRQMERGGLSPDTRLQTPVASIRQLLAMEADARARTISIAMELEFLKPDDPEERLLFPGMTALAKIEAGVRAIAQLPDGHTMAAAFDAFYTSAGLRQHYEGSVVTAIEAAGDDLKDPKFFTDGKTAAELKAALGAYITADLDAPFFSAVSQNTAEALLRICPGGHAQRIAVYNTNTSTTPQPKTGPAP